jgi:dihydrofolate reductase
LSDYRQVLMTQVILGTTLSLDGFMCDHSGGISRLYPDLASLRHTEFLQESIRTTGAALMSRRANGMIIGGASRLHQIFKAGLFDELSIGIGPVFLEDGLRLFAPNSTLPFELEQTHGIPSPTRTGIFYRVKKS